MRNLTLILLLSTILLSACAPEAEPTMSAEEVQGTAVAAAWTMVAETQAAMPTATPIPPTETPLPIPTNTIAPLALPTQTLLIQPTLTPDKDECDRYLRSDPPGPSTTILIINETKAPMNVSLSLDKTPFGECGYRGYKIPKKGSVKITFPQGVIWGYAWILEPINTVVQGGPWKPNNPDKWIIEIDEHKMKMVGP